MKIELFGTMKSGILVPIKTLQGDDHAFVPSDLPRNWPFSETVWPLLVEARDRVSLLNGIGQTLPHPRLLLRPLQRREAVHSSAIEGTHASPSELMLFELERKRSKGESSPSRDDERAEWEEVFNYYNALKVGHNWMCKQNTLNADLLKLLHKVLMRGVRGSKKNPGEFREQQVYVDNWRFNPPPRDHMHKCLDQLFNYLADESDRTDPLIRAFLAHYQFEAIHPFSDGNGRIGRLLLSLCISGWLEHYRPWLYLSEFFEDNRDMYIRHLFEISTESAWEEWVTFCLKGTILQANDAISRCQAMREVQKKYHDLTAGGSGRMHRIIEMLFNMPLIQVGDIERRCNVTYPTAKKDLEYLVEKGVLEEDEDSYPRTFYAPRLFKIAYGD